ncbi:MAG TPA: lysophospholipid acyltransferase family protein [Propionibacteriaceae bacterium]|nr:lysophospholipid acyltransferase family protein [Propionibacteriaceae bacterium]
MAAKPNRGRYTSKTNLVARTAAQMLLLKPVVWRMVQVNVHGTEHLGTVEGPFIAVANHSSHLDAALVFGSMPRRLSQNMATGAAADYFFDKWWKAAPTSLFFNAFPIERGTRARKGMETELQNPRARRGLAGQLLSDGVPLLIFPEGTRSRTGAMGPFVPGAAALSISRNVPVIPVALVGAFAAWPYQQSTPPRGRPPVHIAYGRPMIPQPGEIAHTFNERIRRQVIELHDSTATAYGMPTLAEYARTLAIEKARRSVGTGDAAASAPQTVETSVTPVLDTTPPEPSAGTTPTDAPDI